LQVPEHGAARAAHFTVAARNEGRKAAREATGASFGRPRSEHPAQEFTAQSGRDLRERPSRLRRAA